MHLHCGRCAAARLGGGDLLHKYFLTFIMDCVAVAFSALYVLFLFASFLTDCDGALERLVLHCLLARGTVSDRIPWDEASKPKKKETKKEKD